VVMVDLEFGTAGSVLGVLSESTLPPVTVTSTTRIERGDKTKKENGLHVGGAEEVGERAVHPCRGDGHRNQNGHREHLEFQVRMENN
jgi:hypothetical protein